MADKTQPAQTGRTGRNRKRAGAFDIRNVIGALIGIYGVVLLAMGLFGDPELEKTGGVNANAITGIAMLVAAVVFFLWARLRPLAVPQEPREEEG
ncbi:hypothetical protein MF406_03705 [Georgenia sp. TF02-10]|uniref:hypothetical protein n=1 Tax=Georgenia sp. TF02-10 TaxID=2917725 RepID=UPI001FA74824|nr:hypothetical protein [Georgenia sp. TF02-10]UNX55385.1 hypothetical protein MF406_03705 [Georgenia sp. TF02-10]